MLTAGAWLNAVVPLPNEGFIVTRTYDPTDAHAREKMAGSQYAGAVYEWQPGRGFAPLPEAQAGGDNGVAISPDGKWLYLNWYFGYSVIRAAHDGIGERVVTPLGFLPDNLDRAPDGSLYITGQDADPRQLMAGCTSGTCPQATARVRCRSVN